MNLVFNNITQIVWRKNVLFFLNHTTIKILLRNRIRENNDFLNNAVTERGTIIVPSSFRRRTGRGTSSFLNEGRVYNLENKRGTERVPFENVLSQQRRRHIPYASNPFALDFEKIRTEVFHASDAVENFADLQTFNLSLFANDFFFFFLALCYFTGNPLARARALQYRFVDRNALFGFYYFCGRETAKPPLFVYRRWNAKTHAVIIPELNRTSMRLPPSKNVILILSERLTCEFHTFFLFVFFFNWYLFTIDTLYVLHFVANVKKPF